jgi:fibronectin-binding autotransporter adhesin
VAWGGGGAFIAGNSSTANQASQNFTVTSTQLVGVFAVLIIAVDNNQTTDGDEGAVTSVTDSAGNTWSKAAEFCNGQGSAQAGATCSIWYSTITSQLTGASSTITVNFSNAASRDKSAVGGSGAFTIGAGSVVSVQGTNTLANDGADPGSLNFTTPNEEFLRVRGIAGETNSTTALTNTAGFTSTDSSQTSGGGATANMAVRGEWIISTGTGAASDPTWTAVDCASVYVAFKETLGGAVIGSTSFKFTPSASLGGSGALAALSSNKFTPTGALNGSGALAGAISAIFSATATGTNILPGSIVGSTTVTFSPSAALSGTANLAGTSANTFTASGVLKGAGALAGTSLVTFSPSGSLAGSETLAGLSSNVFTPSASLTGAGRLIGSAANLFTVSGALTGSGALAGLSANIFSATATLTSLGSGAISGLSSALFSGSASLSGDGALAGASNLFFTASGTLIDISAPVQPTQVTEQPAGRSRKRKQRFIARFKGKDHFFRSIEGLEAFVKSVTKPAELKQSNPPVKIIVPASIDDEMAEYDLPSLQPILSKFDWTKAKAVIARANSVMEGVEKRMAMDMEDEELLLL